MKFHCLPSWEAFLFSTTNMNTTKICSKCRRELPIENFANGGKQYYCRECMNAYMRDRHKAKRGGQVEEKKPDTKNHEAEEKMHKVYTHKDLAKFQPRELMLELKARGYEGELVFREYKVIEHRISLGKLE